MPSEPSIPPWVDWAARLPVAFAQVREDAQLDLAVLREIAEAGGRPAADARLRVLMIASGGCTAAALAASGLVDDLVLVDANPAQVALAWIKLHLLCAATPAERRALLGHTPMPAGERAARLLAALSAPCRRAGTAVSAATSDVGPPITAAGQIAALGPADLVAGLGPDHAGRYEVLFARLRDELAAVGAADELAGVLALRDPAEQARRADPAAPLGRALDAAFDRAMALPILIRLFGEAATQNAREPFARHFARRARHVLATLPAADNPYLWQMLAGRFPASAAHPWLDAPPPPELPACRSLGGPMDDGLRWAAATADADRPGYDLVHLSNILDWLTPDQARRTLALAHAALRPGGRVLIRQLNSTLDVPALGRQFDWLADEADRLHARDRSFFYRSLHLGRKPPQGRTP